MDRGRIDALIVGGGIAGLSLAAYLDRQGIDPTVVERRSEWTDEGFGIGLWGDAVDVLDELGVGNEVRDRAADPDGFAIRSGRGEMLSRAAFRPGRTAPLVVHRADLHAALRGAVPAEWIRMGTSPRRIDERGDEVAVTFEDGTTERYDLVVGADGVHSTVRGLCFEDWTRREFDTVVWSLWGPGDVPVGDDLVSVWGPGSEGFVARIGDRVVVNLAARVDGVPDPPALDDLRARASATGWRLPALVEAADGEPFFDRLREVVCETWHSDRVVLVGDAAHAVHPISGMGASLALRDARVLAQELATAAPEAPGDALEAYEARRRNEAERVRRTARFEAAVTFLESPALRRLRNGVVRHTPIVDLFVRRTADRGSL